MKVRDLVNKLSQLNQKRDILLSSDEEGNSFHNVDGLFGEGRTDNGVNCYIIFPEGEWIELSDE